MTAAPRKYSTLTLYSRLILQARPYWSRVCGYLVLSLLATPLALLIPLPLKIAIDHVLQKIPDKNGQNLRASISFRMTTRSPSR